jgi:hypothetical protein
MGASFIDLRAIISAAANPLGNRLVAYMTPSLASFAVGSGRGITGTPYPIPELMMRAGNKEMSKLSPQ